MRTSFAGARLTLNLNPLFHPGEKVLFTKRWVWAGSFKSLPSFRVFFSAPPLSEATMYVTDRRVMLVFHVLRTITLEASMYYINGVLGAKELLKAVRVGKNRVFGKYLEIVSEKTLTKRYERLYRSSTWRHRIFMKDPELLCRIIGDAMETAAEPESEST